MNRRGMLGMLAALVTAPLAALALPDRPKREEWGDGTQFDYGPKIDALDPMAFPMSGDSIAFFQSRHIPPGHVFAVDRSSLGLTSLPSSSAGEYVYISGKVPPATLDYYKLGGRERARQLERFIRARNEAAIRDFNRQFFG